MESFEKILLISLKSMLSISEKINITHFEDYHTGKDIIDSNMNVKFIKPYYLFHSLNDNLKNKNLTHKKIKI